MSREMLLKPILFSLVAGIIAWVITENIIVVLVVAAVVQIATLISIRAARKRDDEWPDV
tara:strand:+ start:321 stop:497 length:177 start_codon:yes stop_codon:yes gene_type:complete